MTDANVGGHVDQGGLTPGGAGDEQGKLRALLLDFGDRWEIEQGAAWVACTRSGSFTHVIAAHTLDGLRTKIAAAERPDAAGADPGERP
ncbi:MAG: hypothetical protein ACRDQ1_21480, partial [Sciscionella sp.]